MGIDRHGSKRIVETGKDSITGRSKKMNGKISDKGMDEIANSLNYSEVFKATNEKIKKICVEHNKTLTQKEYNALRSIIVMKTILEDKKVFKIVADEVTKGLCKA